MACDSSVNVFSFYRFKKEIDMLMRVIKQVTKVHVNGGWAQLRPRKGGQQRLRRLTGKFSFIFLSFGKGSSMTLFTIQEAEVVT